MAIKVLWLSSSYPRFDGDSASVFLRYLAQSLTTQDYQIHVLAPDDRLVDAKFSQESVSVHRFPYFFPSKFQRLAYGSGILPNLKANPWLYWQVPWFLISQLFCGFFLVERIKPALIHAHWLFPQGLLAVLLGKLTGIPVVISAHGGDAFALKGGVLDKLKSWAVKNCQQWTSNTTATANAAGENLPIPVVIPMGVDCELFESGKPVMQQFKGSLLLFVGRLVEKKGVAHLLTAFSLLSENARANTCLWIIGDGSERAALEALVKQLRIEKQVVFHGRIPNEKLPAYYAAADIFIAPSVTDSLGDTEGQGVILLEAMASGVAVVASRTGGISEIISDGTNGLLTDPANPESLKRAIEQLLADSQLRQRLAEEGRNFVQAYDWRCIGAQFAKLYRRVAAC